MKSTHRNPSFGTHPALLAWSAALALLLCGCAGVKPKHMTPKTKPAAGAAIGKSIRVVEVSGGRKSTFGGADYINDEKFKAALLMTLKNSGLFTSVSEKEGDLELRAIMRAQDQITSRGLQYTARMVVSYEVKDRAGAAVWAQSFESKSSSTAFAGGTRTVRAREGSARENLTSFIQELATGFPRK